MVIAWVDAPAPGAVTVAAVVLGGDDVFPPLPPPQLLNSNALNAMTIMLARGESQVIFI